MSMVPPARSIRVGAEETTRTCAIILGTDVAGCWALSHQGARSLPLQSAGRLPRQRAAADVVACCSEAAEHGASEVAEHAAAKPPPSFGEVRSTLPRSAKHGAASCRARCREAAPHVAAKREAPWRDARSPLHRSRPVRGGCLVEFEIVSPTALRRQMG